MPDRTGATGSVTVGRSVTGEIETASGLAHKEERAMQARRLGGMLGRPGAVPPLRPHCRWVTSTDILTPPPPIFAE